MLTSAVICTRNRTKETLICVDSLMNQTCRPDEIIVVDASDVQELRTLFKSRGKDQPVPVTYLHTRPGLTYQRNTGVGVARGDIVFFFDDDVVVDPGFFAAVLSVFENDPKKKIGGVAGRITNMEATNPRGLRRLVKELFCLPKFGDGRFRLSGFPTWFYGDEQRVVEDLPGGLTAYRREVLNDHSFDERLTGYCYMEDDDFSYRVSRKYDNVYCPTALVRHCHAPGQRVDRQTSRKMLVRNHHYLFKKNFPQNPVRRLAFNLSLVGLVIDALLARDTEAFKGVVKGVKAVYARRTI